jgi:hypothetical protein
MPMVTVDMIKLLLMMMIIVVAASTSASRSPSSGGSGGALRSRLGLRSCPRRPGAVAHVRKSHSSATIRATPPTTNFPKFGHSYLFRRQCSFDSSALIMNHARGKGRPQTRDAASRAKSPLSRDDAPALRILSRITAIIMSEIVVAFNHLARGSGKV